MDPSKARRTLLLSGLALCALALPSGAAPIVRPAEITLTVEITGIGIDDVATPLGVTTAASVSVDPATGSIALAAGAVQLGSPISIPVTSSTALQTLSLQNLTNASALFSVGGARGIADEPPCPRSGSAACVAQTRFGGVMGIDALMNLVVIPGVVEIPVDLAVGRAGLGGPVGTYPTLGATVDPAPWTLGRATVALGTLTPPVSASGTLGTQSFTLVSPTFYRAFGNQLPVFARLRIEFTDGGGVPEFVGEVVPEPATLPLLAAGLLGLALVARRSR